MHTAARHKKSAMHPLIYLSIVSVALGHSTDRIYITTQNEITNGPSVELSDHARGRDKDASAKGPTQPPLPQAVFSKVRNGLATIECPGQGTGSGFLLRERNTVWLITNAHVARLGPALKARTADGQALRLSRLQIPSDGRDLARFEVLNAERLIPLQLSALVSPGTQIHALGNSLGAGVMPDLPGEVVSVGPDRLEITAEIVQGNSGGPVVDTNGLVLGISTYLLAPTVPDQLDWSTAGTRFTEVRRFALRMDTAIPWQNVDVTEYYNWANVVDDVLPFIYEMIPVFQHYYSKDEEKVLVTPGVLHTYRSTRYQSHIQKFYAAYSGLADTLKRIQGSYDHVRASIQKTGGGSDRNERNRLLMLRPIRQEKASAFAKASKDIAQLCKGVSVELSEIARTHEFMQPETQDMCTLLRFFQTEVLKLAADAVQVKSWE